jgi:hypothetical protein
VNFRAFAAKYGKGKAAIVVIVTVLLGLGLLAYIFMSFTRLNYAVSKMITLDTSIETKNAYMATATCKGVATTLAVNGKTLQGDSRLYAGSTLEPVVDTTNFDTPVTTLVQHDVVVHYKLADNRTISQVYLDAIGEPGRLMTTPDIKPGSEGTLTYDTSEPSVDRITRVTVCITKVPQ